MFEGGARVPALMTWPDVIRPGDVSEPVAAMDVAPTIAKSGSFDGIDLSALLQKRSAVAERARCWEYDGQIAARRGRWKLLTSHREFLGGPLTKSDWLSDLASDPGETKNFAAAHPDVVSRLKADIASWKLKNDPK